MGKNPKSYQKNRPKLSPIQGGTSQKDTSTRTNSESMIFQQRLDARSHSIYTTTDAFFQSISLNHFKMLPKFFSWKPSCSGCSSTTVGSLQVPYAFPPFVLIQKVLEEKVSHVLVIAPVRLAQHWYPLIIQMLADYPLLPDQTDLLNPHQ